MRDPGVQYDRAFRPGTTQLTNAEHQHAVEQVLRYRRPAAVLVFCVHALL